jgi:hypothetical protein
LAQPAPAFEIDRGRIRLGDDVFVYLERMLVPPEPLPPEVAPRPHGVAPTAALPDGGVVAAVGPGEAVWLGFQPVEPARAMVVRVRVDGPEPLDAVTGEPWDEGLAEEPRNYLRCPPDYRLPGRTFAVGERASVLSYGAPPALASFELVPLEEFTSLTGIPAKPRDPESAYKGWRLP